MKKNKKLKKMLALVLVLITMLSSVAVIASAAKYTTGRYIVSTSSGVNVRKGAGSGYSKVGAASKNVSFDVSKVDGSWGYTSSIKCTNGYKSGWVSLDYCKYTNQTTSASPSKTSFDPIWPCAKSGDYVITTLYYYRYYNNGAKHGCKWSYKNAIDIAGVGGNIVAIEDGTVELASNSYGGFGKCVIIKHNNGTKSLYGHLKSISVSQGQKVSRGQKIGVMGSTGNSTGTHLHFELNNADPFMEYYNDKYAGKIKIDTDVYGSAKEHRNSDSVSKTLYNLINSSYKKVNGYYVHK